MGCLDGAEFSELVGVYILHLLRTVMRKQNVGFYRNDGLGIVQNSSRSEKERKRKWIMYKIEKDLTQRIEMVHYLQELKIITRASFFITCTGYASY